MNSLNLLPWKFRRRLLLRVRVTQWAVATAVACGLVLAAAGVQFAQIARREQTLARLEARCESLATMRVETARIEGRVAESRRLQALLSRVENQELPVKAMGLVSGVVRVSRGRLELTTVTLARVPVSVPVPNKPKESAQEERVTLTVAGKAADNLAVADMVLRLRESNVFDQVDLRPASTALDRSGLVAFHVDCAYQAR